MCICLLLGHLCSSWSEWTLWSSPILGFFLTGPPRLHLGPRLASPFCCLVLVLIKAALTTTTASELWSLNKVGLLTSTMAGLGMFLRFWLYPSLLKATRQSRPSVSKREEKNLPTVNMLIFTGCLHTHNPSLSNRELWTGDPAKNNNVVQIFYLLFIPNFFFFLVRIWTLFLFSNLGWHLNCHT